MTDDPELRAGVAAFLHSWAAMSEPFRQKLEDPASVQKCVDLILKEKGFGDMFRMFHSRHARYPTFEDLCPPGSPSLIPKNLVE